MGLCKKIILYIKLLTVKYLLLYTCIYGCGLYSCMALSDLLVTRQVGEVAEHIPELWTLVLRVRDDIKVSMRYVKQERLAARDV